MPTIRKQYYGIKFPITANNDRMQFIDLNEKVEDKVATEISHVLLTPKRSRIRKPEFGTNLVKFIFEPSDNVTWEDVKKEAVEAVSKYVTNAELNNVEVITENDTNSIFLDLVYSVKRGLAIENKRTIIKI